VFNVSALLLTDPSTIRPNVEDKRGNVPSVRTYVLPSVSEVVTSYVRIDCTDYMVPAYVWIIIISTITEVLSVRRQVHY
jgi:hypothetical protein